MPLAALGVLGAVGSIGGAAIGASAAGNAAKTQSAADQQAAQIAAQNQNQALQFEQAQLGEAQREYNQNQSNIAPFLQAGQSALPQLQALAGNVPANFTAPTEAQAEQTPGYQFTLDQGMKALQNSAAARGGLLTTGNLKNIAQYSQGLASTTYGNLFNQALQGYQANQQNLSNSFNRLGSLAGMGQGAASQIANLQNPYAGNQTPQTLLSGAQLQGQALTSSGAAQASGIASQGNIWGSAVNSLGQMPFNLYALNQISRGSGYGSGYGGGGLYASGYPAGQAPPNLLGGYYQ